MHRQNLTQYLVLSGTLALPLTAFAWPQMNYGLSLNGNLGNSSFSSNLDFDEDLNLSGINMNLSGASLRAQAGDISANWDQLGLAGRSFQGLTTGFALGKMDLSLLGGTVVLQPDYRNPRFGDPLLPVPAPVVSSVYGVRASVPLGNQFNLSAAQLITPDASAVQGKSIGTLSLNYQPSTLRHLALELAHSRQGGGWQLSGATKSTRLQLRASYRQTDIGFSAAGNPSLLTRRNGGFINLTYLIAKPLSLTANSQRYDDGRDGHSDSDSLTLRYAEPKKPTMSLFWRSSETQRSAIISPFLTTEPVDAAATSIGLRMAHRIGSTRFSGQYERLQFNDSSDLSSNDTSNRFSLSLARPLGRRTQLSVFQILDVGARKRTSFTSLGLSHRVRNTNLTVDLGFQYQNVASVGAAGQSTSLRTGLSYALPSGNSLGIQYQSGISHSGSLSAGNNSHLYLGYSHNFHSRNGRNQNLSLQERRQRGKISGRVFEDMNGNGKWESGEPGVPDVAVNILGNTKQKSDVNGRFNMADVRPGTYQFGIETKTLPIEYTCLNSGDAPVQVMADKSTGLDIPVVRTGQVQGMVFNDTNRNGVRDEGEQGVANAMVNVDGSDIIGFTNLQGHFTLYGLAPKKHRVAVDTSVLGYDTESTGAGAAEVVVPPNGEVTGIALGIAAKQRIVIDSFQTVQ